MEEAANPDRRVLRSIASLWGALCVALCVQCTSIERTTRVAVAVDAEANLRVRIAHVDLAFYTAIKTDAWRMRGQERLRTEGAGAWPLQFSFARSQVEDKRYSLEARALDADNKVLAELRAVGDFRNEETVQLALTFDASCVEACGEGRTCRGGACVDAQVTPNMIVSSMPSDAGDSAAGRDAANKPGSTTGAMLAPCADAAGCVNECGPDHGGCDPSVSCKLEGGKPRCGMCPDGFEQESDGSCSALLQALEVTGAGLDPEFSPDHTEYTLKLGLIARQWSLTPTAATGAQLSVDGAPVPAGTPITSQLVAAGSDQLVVEVAGPQGPARKYSFKLLAHGEELAFVKATTPTTDAHFGHRTALDGDTLIVSAEGEDSSATGINPSNPPRDGAANSGAVYVYKRIGSSWELEAYIKASDSRQDAGFGRGLAFQGDTLVVGAWKDNNRGAVYVYERVAGVWKEQVKLLPDEQNETNFGQSVALAGDLMVIGAPTYDFGASESGAAFVYRRSADGSWVFERKLVNERPMALAWIGSSVTLSEDYLVLGATGEGNGSVASGTAYVFRTDTFEQIDVLKPSTASATAFFGERAAISGDTIAVTAFNNNAGFDKGLVYIFKRNAAGKFEEATTIQASNASGGDQFGFSIALTEDYMLVGAVHESSGTAGINGSLSAPALENSGAAYLFARTATGFNQIAHIKASEPAAGAQLGFDVAISGADIVVSANCDPRAATGSGAVYVFR